MTINPDNLPEHIFLGYQKEWADDKATTKILAKSRRIGGSWSEAGDSALYAASEGKSGGDVIYIGYKKEMASEFIADVANFAKVFEYGASDMEESVFDDEDKDILTYMIRFSSGYKVEALTSSPRSLRGKGKNRPRVIIDEAAFHDDLKALIKAAIALKVWGASIRFISSHNGVDNPFNELLEEIKIGKRPGSVHVIDFHRAVADGLYKRVCLYTGKEWSQESEDVWKKEIIDEYGDDADEELFCIPAQGEGKFFTRQTILACMRDDIPILSYAQTDDWAEKPDHERYAETKVWCDENLKPLLEAMDPDRCTWFGEDFARDQNLTVIWPGQEKQDATLRVPFAVELFNMPYRQQEQILFYIIDGLPRFAGGAMDARGNGQALAEFAMQKYGSERIHMIKVTDPWYGRYFPLYKDTLQSREMEIPASADVMEDHRCVCKVKGIPKIAENQKATGKKKRHGDSAIAGVMLAYAVSEIAFSGEFEAETAVPLESAQMFEGY